MPSLKQKMILLFLPLTLILCLLYYQFFYHHEKPKSKIHEHGYWIASKVKHKFDRSLAREIILFFQKEKVSTCADFGAGGYGHYVRFFKEHGIDCEGFDGNPFSLSLSHGLVEVLDLSQPIHLKKSYDWVISIEVGEHLPPQYEKNFIENLDRHAVSGIIISWALKGQSGRGHCNCRDNDYIKKLFAAYGYINDVETEKALRDAASFPWLKTTIMVFRKNNHSATSCNEKGTFE